MRIWLSRDWVAIQFLLGWSAIEGMECMWGSLGKERRKEKREREMKGKREREVEGSQDYLGFWKFGDFGGFEDFGGLGIWGLGGLGIWGFGDLGNSGI